MQDSALIRPLQTERWIDHHAFDLDAAWEDFTGYGNVAGREYNHASDVIGNVFHPQNAEDQEYLNAVDQVFESLDGVDGLEVPAVEDLVQKDVADGTKSTYAIGHLNLDVDEVEEAISSSAADFMRELGSDDAPEHVGTNQISLSRQAPTSSSPAMDTAVSVSTRQVDDHPTTDSQARPVEPARAQDASSNATSAAAANEQQKRQAVSEVLQEKLEIKMTLDPEHLPWGRTRELIAEHEEAGTLVEGFRFDYRTPVKAFAIPLNTEGGKTYYMIIEYVPAGFWWWSEGARYRLAGIVPVTMQPNLALETLVFDKHAIAGAYKVAGALEFTLHIIPLGAAADYASQGEWKEAAISVAADAAMVMTGGASKAITTSVKGQQIIRTTGAVIEGTVAGIRGYQAVHKFYNGQGGWGEAGEALLRLYGVKITLTGNATKSIGTAASKYRQLAGSSDEVARVMGRATASVKSLVDDLAELGIKAERIRPGTNGKVAIIGRGMEEVRRIKGILKSKGYNVEIFDSQIPREMLKDFRDAVNGANAAELKRLDLFELNRKWAETLRDEGFTVLDIGDPLGRFVDETNPGWSVYYALEKSILFP